MLDIFADLMIDPETMVEHGGILEASQGYFPKLNSKLSDNLRVIKEIVKKEIDHKKLSKQFKIFKEISEKFTKLQSIQNDNTDSDYYIDDDINSKHELDYVKAQLEEGVKLVNMVYNPGNCYTFFMRNEGRELFKCSLEQETRQKVDTSNPTQNILSFLNFQDAVNFSEALGKKPSNFLNPQAFPEKCAELGSLIQNLKKHSLSDEHSSKRQALDPEAILVNSRNLAQETESKVEVTNLNVSQEDINHASNIMGEMAET